jgi:hypothetical protein
MVEKGKNVSNSDDSGILRTSVTLCCTWALLCLQHHPFSTILFACEMQKEQPGVTGKNGHRIWI